MQITARGACLLISTILGASLTSVVGGEAAHSLTKLDGGYYLFHSLADDETNVPMLMIVKHAPKEIAQFSDEMGQVAKKSVAAMDRFRDYDSSLRFDENPLPAIEQDVRNSIKADKQHQLLFGTSDSEFVPTFLISQIEAATYATHLAKVLSEQETDSGRAKTLQNLSNDWGIARARAYRLLRNYSR